MSWYDINGNQIHAIYDKNGATVGRDRANFKVMTYNVGSWYIGTDTPIPTDKKESYTQLQQGIFDRNPCDIVMLQEFSNVFCQDGTTCDSAIFNGRYSNVKKEIHGYGMMGGRAIAYNNLQASNYRCTSFANANHTAYYPTWEAIDISINGKTVTMINVHMPYKTPELVQYSDEIESILSQFSSFICAGDWNIGTTTQNADDLWQTNYINRFTDLGYKSVNCSDGRWFKTYGGGTVSESYTDNIIVSSDIDIVSAYVDTIKDTDDIAEKVDHSPIIAEFLI